MRGSCSVSGRAFVITRWHVFTVWNYDIILIWKQTIPEIIKKENITKYRFIYSTNTNLMTFIPFQNIHYPHVGQYFNIKLNIINIIISKLHINIIHKNNYYNLLKAQL